jgi:uracil-DNA glycosylase
MTLKIEAGWKQVLKDEFDQEYIQKLCVFLKGEQSKFTVYPPNELLFQAFESTPFQDVKVVILGQDPYHQPGQAHGLAFSVPEGIRIPPSLRNIYKELLNDIPGFKHPSHGNLTYWAEQGVLLLNTTLSVRKNQAGSHQKQGWERFTDRVIQLLSEQRSDLVFLLWGRYARDKAQLIDQGRHLVLTAPHPSPLSAYHGFLGCGHFSKANQHLIRLGQKPIDWQIR